MYFTISQPTPLATGAHHSNTHPLITLSFLQKPHFCTTRIFSSHLTMLLRCHSWPPALRRHWSLNRIHIETVIPVSDESYVIPLIGLTAGHRRMRTREL